MILERIFFDFKNYEIENILLISYEAIAHCSLIIRHIIPKLNSIQTTFALKYYFH